MLHYKTIDPATLELLKKLQALPEFEGGWYSRNIEKWIVE